MGWNDHLEDSEESNLPEEAFENTFNVDGPIEISNQWIENASQDDQLVAMRAWFLARFCDPAYDTPYNGREGGYQFIHGSHEPDHELFSRFGGLVRDEIIYSLVEELVVDVGDEWAPICREPPDDYDYDARFALEVAFPGDPLINLKERLNQANEVLSLQGGLEAKSLAENLVFGSIVSVLESFLWETMDYWIEHSDDVLKNIITKSSKFKSQSLVLCDIFNRHEGLRKEVKGFLQRMVWHNLKEVKKIFEDGFGVELPDVAQFDEYIVKRHDIIHRSGRTADGQLVTVTVAEIAELSDAVEQFAEQVSHSIKGTPSQF